MKLTAAIYRNIKYRSTIYRSIIKYLRRDDNAPLNRYGVAAGILFAMAVCGSASAERVDSLRYSGQLTLSASGGANTPFWMVNDTEGLGSLRKNNGRLQLGIFKDMDRHSRWSWGAGVELVGGVRQETPFSVHQAYGEIRYRCLDLMAGAKVIPGDINDTRLSTGNLLYSGNARPIPQVRAGIFDFADIWGTKGWLGIKGYLAFGKFMDSKYLRTHISDGMYPQGVLYHSKGIWLRNGNREKFPLTFEVGIEMATQFGGKYPVKLADGTIEYRKAPSGLKAFWKALIPQPGGKDTEQGEYTNVEGNFLGNWNFCLKWEPKADWSLKVYYQHMFEDHSQLYIDYPWHDGMWGVEAKLPRNRFVSKVVYEFLYFKDQSGPVYWDHTSDLDIQVSGRDRYYENYMYGAWQNYGYLIGNPLAVSPIYNRGTLTLLSTRFWAHHIGLEGNPTDELSYRVLCTYSLHWGTYRNPLPEVEGNFNFLGEVKWAPKRFKGWEGTLSVGADGKGLLGRSVGAQISISKTGFIKF